MQKVHALVVSLRWLEVISIAYILPKELVNRFGQIVTDFHKLRGFGKLAALLKSKENILILRRMPETGRILRNVSLLYKARISSVIFIVLCTSLGYFYSWWYLLFLIAGVILYVQWTLDERNSWMILLTGLLSIEVLANNFAGWGAEFPEGKLKRCRSFHVKGNVCGAIGWIFIYQIGITLNPRSSKNLPRRDESWCAPLKVSVEILK